MPGAAYPPELAQYVVDHWPTGTPLRISREALAEILSIAFQTSLTSEEARALRFRLLLSEPDRLPEDGAPNVGVLRLRFERPRGFTVDELRRLAPATPFESSLIGVAPKDGRISIWGVAHSGPAWLAPAWGGRSVVPIWTHDPIVHVGGPGQLAVRTAGKLVGGLERGALLDTTMDVFESQWLRAAFARQQGPVSGSPAAEGSLIGLVSQHMLRRCIQIIRGGHHGGMLLLADSSCVPGMGTPDVDLSELRLKFRFVADEPSRRYRGLLSSIVEHVSRASTNAAPEWADFASSDSHDLAKLEQAVFEWSRLVGNLAAIDGAVVLDKHFALVGFGAEVSTERSGPGHVHRALDVEGRRREKRDIEHVGTRHRAAYRFVHGHPHGLAIVISQDGGVTFVAKRGDDVVFWEQSVGF